MLALGAPVAPEKTIFRVLARDEVVVDARWTDATTPDRVRNVPRMVRATGS